MEGACTWTAKNALMTFVGFVNKTLYHIIGYNAWLILIPNTEF